MKIIGIDGGGTKTLSYLADEDLTILQELKTGSTNYLSVGIDEVEKNLKYIISSLITKADEEYILSLGLAGISRKEDIKVMNMILKRLNVKNYILNNDAYVAFHGALGGQDGALLIAGTGSILYYREGQNIRRAGGYGHLIGDKGSGYSIAKEAIVLTLETNDKLRNFPELLDFILDAYSLDCIEDIITMIYRDFEKSHIARLTKLLLESGLDIEGVKPLLEREAKELVKLCEVLPLKSKIVLSGGLLEHENYYSKLVKSMLREKYVIVNKMYNPAYGALLIGKERMTRKDNS